MTRPIAALSCLFAFSPIVARADDVTTNPARKK